MLEAAEELFSERGFDRVSLREVTLRAGANSAAVNYHFGNREGLVDQVLTRYISAINEERLARLDVLEGKAGKKPLPLESILDAFVRPFVTQVRRSELSEKLFYKLMGRIFGHQAGRMPEAVEAEFGVLIGRFIAALHRALPDLPEEELLWRTHFMVGAMIHTMAHAESLNRISGGASGQPSMEQTMSRFIRFTVAGISAGQERSSEQKAKDPQGEFHF